LLRGSYIEDGEKYSVRSCAVRELEDEHWQDLRHPTETRHLAAAGPEDDALPVQKTWLSGRAGRVGPGKLNRPMRLFIQHASNQFFPLAYRRRVLTKFVGSIPKFCAIERSSQCFCLLMIASATLNVD
jgi:hypothetical protein